MGSELGWMGGADGRIPRRWVCLNGDRVWGGVVTEEETTKGNGLLLGFVGLCPGLSMGFRALAQFCLRGLVAGTMFTIVATVSPPQIKICLINHLVCYSLHFLVLTSLLTILTLSIHYLSNSISCHIRTITYQRS